jgi:hypothetical protein
MAAPVIVCPACTKKFRGKEGLEGKRIKCPLCTTPFVVTSEQIKAGAGQPKGKATPTLQRVTWTKDDEDSTAYQLGKFDIRPRCPNCANLMESEEAIVCLFCGYNTQTRQWGNTLRTTSVTGGQHFVYLLPGLMFALMLLIFIVGILMFCNDLPGLVTNTWAWFFDHESMRMWIVGIALCFMWVFGWLSVKRLVLYPKPKEREKETTSRSR